MWGVSGVLAFAGNASNLRPSPDALQANRGQVSGRIVSYDPTAGLQSAAPTLGYVVWDNFTRKKSMKHCPANWSIRHVRLLLYPRQQRPDSDPCVQNRSLVNYAMGGPRNCPIHRQ